MNKGGVFIISGPSGSGKDTVLAELFKKRPDVLFSISSIILIQLDILFLQDVKQTIILSLVFSNDSDV